MADNQVIAEIVSDFFVHSCRQRRRLNEDTTVVLNESSRILNDLSHMEFEVIPLTTGSVAEFCIEPMLSCVGDVDIMVQTSNVLAIPRGHPPPIQLPNEFHGRVRIYEIIDSEFPGYVYLLSSYLLTEITDDGKYNAVQCPRQYWEHSLTHEQDVQGPAFVMKRSHQSLTVIASLIDSGSVSSTDRVPCVRCLSWPLQAADWPTRYRNYGWPDSATVDRVVSNGCDLVSVAHRLCRQDEWMRKHQWRLSFSRAEITLLNSWMKVQQIVYHSYDPS